MRNVARPDGGWGPITAPSGRRTTPAELPTSTASRRDVTPARPDSGPTYQIASVAGGSAGRRGAGQPGHDVGTEGIVGVATLLQHHQRTPEGGDGGAGTGEAF